MQHSMCLVFKKIALSWEINDSASEEIILLNIDHNVLSTVKSLRFYARIIGNPSSSTLGPRERGHLSKSPFQRGERLYTSESERIKIILTNVYP